MSIASNDSKPVGSSCAAAASVSGAASPSAAGASAVDKPGMLLDAENRDRSTGGAPGRPGREPGGGGSAAPTASSESSGSPGAGAGSVCRSASMDPSSMGRVGAVRSAANGASPLAAAAARPARAASRRLSSRAAETSKPSPSSRVASTGASAALARSYCGDEGSTSPSAASSSDSCLSRSSADGLGRGRGGSRGPYQACGGGGGFGKSGSAISARISSAWRLRTLSKRLPRDSTVVPKSVSYISSCASVTSSLQPLPRLSGATRK